ncbi:MAG: hypothetical protein PWQ10_277 [Patescibacteria group bacterium]|nr:hypothetical protein [Patescibacteria group bacterium]
MQMKLLALPPSKMLNKAVSKYELGRYFQADSVEGLITTLQYGERMGLFNFDVIISPEYLDWAEMKHKLLNPIDLSMDLGFRKPVPYELYGLSGKIKNSEPLEDAEIQRIIVDAPHEILNQYFRFKLREVDYEELRNYVQQKTNQAEKDRDYGTVRYNGLVAEGAKITYHNQPIYMGFQHRQVLRLLIEQKGVPCSKDEFKRNADIFTRDSYSSGMDAVLRNLIYEVRKKIKVVVGKNCIKNKPLEGWYLELDP